MSPRWSECLLSFSGIIILSVKLSNILYHLCIHWLYSDLTQFLQSREEKQIFVLYRNFNLSLSCQASLGRFSVLQHWVSFQVVEKVLLLFTIYCVPTSNLSEGTLIHLIHVLPLTQVLPWGENEVYENSKYCRELAGGAGNDLFSLVVVKGGWCFLSMLVLRETKIL